jgi:hypothetical protein
MLTAFIIRHLRPCEEISVRGLYSIFKGGRVQWLWKAAPKSTVWSLRVSRRVPGEPDEERHARAPPHIC